MTTRFERDAGDAYEVWLDANPAGYVLNHFGGSNPRENVVHRATCPHLHRPEDRGRRTEVPKVCGSAFDVWAAASELCGRAGWTGCGTCGDA